MEIRELEREQLSEAELSELARFADLVDPERLPGDQPHTAQLVFDKLAPSTRFREHRSWAAYEDGRVVAAARAFGSRGGVDNADLWDFTVAVDPALRRQGLGRRLFEHVEAYGRANGRTKLWTWGAIDEPTSGFYEAMGMTQGLDERISRCVLADVDPDLMQSWIDRASERAAGYRLERWIGACPDDLLPLFAAARQAMNDAPLDELEMEPESFDGDRMRDLEYDRDQTGLDSYMMLAIETDTNRAAGYTGILVSRARPAISFQGDTVTLAEHRNRGLGRWMKAALWQWTRAERPDVVSLDTGNAESNEAMLAINLEMGYRGFANLGVWQ